MSVDRVSSRLEQSLSEPPASRSDLWRRRLQRLRTRARSGLPFASGVFAALVALLLYQVLVPDPPQLTARDVNDSVAQALASATPPPAFAASVYQVIQPSLVLVQAQAPGANGKVEHGVGSGVIINDRGDI
ncbi:MAG: hypothetical protein M3380_21000, partial [Chloroflexota bacterium]|nr:hypothetical protein [Chloroflexota bacterium]